MSQQLSAPGRRGNDFLWARQWFVPGRSQDCKQAIRNGPEHIQPVALLVSASRPGVESDVGGDRKDEKENSEPLKQAAGNSKLSEQATNQKTNSEQSEKKETDA